MIEENDCGMPALFMVARYTSTVYGNLLEH